MRQATWNHSISGCRDRWRIVPLVTEDSLAALSAAPPAVLHVPVALANAPAVMADEPVRSLQPFQEQDARFIARKNFKNSGNVRG